MPFIYFMKIQRYIYTPSEEINKFSFKSFGIKKPREFIYRLYSNTINITRKNVETLKCFSQLLSLLRLTNILITCLIK